MRLFIRYTMFFINYIVHIYGSIPNRNGADPICATDLVTDSTFFLAGCNYLINSYLPFTLSFPRSVKAFPKLSMSRLNSVLNLSQLSFPSA